MQHRRGGGGGITLRSISLAILATFLIFAAGFYIGHLVGSNPRRVSDALSASRRAAGQHAAHVSEMLASVNIFSTAAGGAAGGGGSGGESDGGGSDSKSPLSWRPDAAAVGLAPICLNTCHKARDGVCDDGQQKPALGVTSLVYCDLGTDCQDCGPWTPTTADVPWRVAGTGGPISRLMQRQVEVRVRRAAHASLAFVFAFTDPQKDVDVSGNMAAIGMVERENSMVFMKVFKGCLRPDGSHALFVDVGANFGWFSVMAASLGCRVAAFEPVPHFHAFLEYNLHLNGVAHLADVRRLIVSAQSGVSLNMTVPSSGIWGTAGIGGLNIDMNLKGTHEIISVPSVKLDELTLPGGPAAHDVLLLKMDVEGWEFSVFQGAQGLFSQAKVQNVIFEYSPGVHERHDQSPAQLETVDMVRQMIQSGLTVAHIPDGGPTVPFSRFFDSELPAMAEVTAYNLAYDTEDVKRMQKYRLGCPLDAERPNHGLPWTTCNAIPEDLSPRSLHSVLGHNTNLWASRDRGSMKLAGPVGLLPPDSPATLYYPVEGAVWGLGRRLCNSIQPEHQVRHRCRCTDKAKCGQTEEMVLLAASKGAEVLTSNYVLPSPS